MSVSTLNEGLTHKGNTRDTRFGWLRLTPAYSVKLVSETIDPKAEFVLDPFCGTGTTALLCAERGIVAATTDINPFLVWLARAKTRHYAADALTEFRYRAEEVRVAALEPSNGDKWLPTIHEIEKWWDEPVLDLLGNSMSQIKQLEKYLSPTVADLLKIVFCRVMIELAHVSFGHQSMSFKRKDHDCSLFGLAGEFDALWRQTAHDVFLAAHSEIRREPKIALLDARCLEKEFRPGTCDHVVTSPPYPNRMSYIRELRPYMYWLGFLRDGREAGELDWQAIGGTWGCATSNVAKWRASEVEVPFSGFAEILRGIAVRSPLLSNYVHKYFVDMLQHVSSLRCVTKRGGSIHYIVGNSKFYDVLLPVEEIFGSLFREGGFHSVTIRTIRKRTSKKELFEFVVSAVA